MPAIWYIKLSALTDQEARKEIYVKIMDKIMNDYTGIYYAWNQYKLS